MPPNPVSELAISETGFVFDPHTGATFNLNLTGLAVLEVIRSGGDRKAIAATLREAFEATPADLEEHLDDFLRTLRQLGISVDEPAPAASPARGGAR